MAFLALRGTALGRNLVIAAVCIAGVAAETRSAHACGASACWPDQFVPYEGTLPANATGIVWRPGRHRDGDAGAYSTKTTTPEELRLECTSADGVVREIEFHATGEGRVRQLVFDEHLVTGDECEITPRYENCAFLDDDPRVSGTARFTVTAAAPIPTSLGVLEMQGGASPRRVAVPASDGSCFHEPLACAAQVGLQWSAEAQPWVDALDIETLVDGEAWAPPSFIGLSYAPPAPLSGTDVVFVANAQTKTIGLGTGAHMIAMQARLPGVDAPIRSDVLELDLTCDGFVPETGDAGTRSYPDAGTDAGDPDASNDESRPTTNRRYGCSAATLRPESRSSLGMTVLILGFAALWMRTRRRNS